MKNEFVTVNFDGQGFCDKKRCLYGIRLRYEKKEYVYIGVTGSSNGKGRNSPFGRLGTHLKKRGKTLSCLYDKKIADISNIRLMRFVSTYINDGDNADILEKWAICNFNIFKNTNGIELLNNKENKCKNIDRAEQKIVIALFERVFETR